MLEIFKTLKLQKHTKWITYFWNLMFDPQHLASKQSPTTILNCTSLILLFWVWIPSLIYNVKEAHSSVYLETLGHAVTVTASQHCWTAAFDLSGSVPPLFSAHSSPLVRMVLTGLITWPPVCSRELTPLPALLTNIWVIPCGCHHLSSSPVSVWQRYTKPCLTDGRPSAQTHLFMSRHWYQ